MAQDGGVVASQVMPEWSSYAWMSKNQLASRGRICSGIKINQSETQSEYSMWVRSAFVISPVDDGIVWIGVLLGLFIWDSACHGASKDIKFVFDGPHGEADVFL